MCVFVCDGVYVMMMMMMMMMCVCVCVCVCVCLSVFLSLSLSVSVSPSVCLYQTLPLVDLSLFSYEFRAASLAPTPK
jgi:hypothetical protein